MIKADQFRDFVDGEEISVEDGFNTCCDICGEWLQYDAKIVYDSVNNSQSIIIESISCGEKFRLVPTGFRMEKIYE